MSSRFVRGFAGCLLLALLFLSACTTNSGGVIPIALPEVRTGTQGVVAQFLEARPPDEVFESADQPIAFSLHNSGAADIRRGAYRIVTNRPTLFIIDETTGFFDLTGKSQSDIRGEEQFYDALIKVGALPSQSQGESGRVDVHLCYQYATIASQEVCVDATLGSPTIQQKVCTQGAVSVSGGQGAPVQLTSVDLKTLPHPSDSRAVLPSVELTFTKPSGKSIVPVSSYSARCTGQPGSSDPHASIRVTLGEEQMKCTSNVVDFRSADTAKIVCTLEKGVDRTRGAYISTIRAELDYGFYDIAAKKTIRVKKLA